MEHTGARRNFPVRVFFCLMATSLGELLPLAPIPQGQSYHQFSDQQTLFVSPNFWNVVWNLPFLVVGAAGYGNFATIRLPLCSS